MIIFQTDTHQLNLTHLKIQLIEESNWFVNDSLRNYSVPFLIDLESDIAKKLGLPHLKNIASYKSIIYGTLSIDSDFYSAYIKIGEVQGKRIEATLFYGEDVLEVYNKNLKDLNWPTITTTDLRSYARSLLDKSYPEATHNFPMMYRPEIKNDDTYADYEYFVNNFRLNAFRENTTTTTEDGTIFRNFNVMAPMPYLLEILRFGYAQEGKEVRGALFESELLKNVVYIPDNYFERFLENQYAAYQFETPNSYQIIEGVEMANYEQVHTPTLEGTYQLKFKVNFTSSIAPYFSLKVIKRDAITQNEIEIYTAFSETNGVNLSENIDINVETDDLYDQIKVQMVIPRQSFSIAPYNSFEFNFKSGRLNVFPKYYSLAEFMPDMTFGDFVNKIKNWLNLDITPQNNIVTLNFIENQLEQLEIQDKEHLQDPNKKSKLNTDRFYSLKYENGEEIKIDYTGQVFINANDEHEVVELTMDIHPMKVEENFDVVTAIYNDSSALKFGIYKPATVVNSSTKPWFVDNLNEEDLSLQQIKDKYWAKWLHFRTNSKTFKDTFLAHTAEIFKLKTAVKKYNEMHLLKKITKKRTSVQFWKVNTESETL